MTEDGPASGSVTTAAVAHLLSEPAKEATVTVPDVAERPPLATESATAKRQESPVTTMELDTRFVSAEAAAQASRPFSVAVSNFRFFVPAFPNVYGYFEVRRDCLVWVVEQWGNPRFQQAEEERLGSELVYAVALPEYVAKQVYYQDGGGIETDELSSSSYGSGEGIHFGDGTLYSAVVWALDEHQLAEMESSPAENCPLDVVLFANATPP